MTMLPTTKHDEDVDEERSADFWQRAVARLSEGHCPACHGELVRGDTFADCPSCRRSWRLRSVDGDLVIDEVVGGDAGWTHEVNKRRPYRGDSDG